ncbi:MAG: RNA polymerase sigma factor [Gaiellaceae bacterium]
MTGEDETLVRELQTDEGHEAARALYRAHGGELYGFAVKRLGDWGLAEELVQDVFTRVWRRAHDFDPRRSSFRTWLYGIARNAVIDLERRRAVRPRLAAHEPPAQEMEGYEPLEQAILRWQVQAALERLTPEHRTVLRLAHFEGLTLREIAERTGVPVGTVKNRASYALRNMRLALDEMEVNG